MPDTAAQTWKACGAAAAHDRLANGRVTKSVTIATDRGGRQRTPTDCLPPATGAGRWQSASVVGFGTKRPTPVNTGTRRSLAIARLDRAVGSIGLDRAHCRIMPY